MPARDGALPWRADAAVATNDPGHGRIAGSRVIGVERSEQLQAARQPKQAATRVVELAGDGFCRCRRMGFVRRGPRAVPAEHVPGSIAVKGWSRQAGRSHFLFDDNRDTMRLSSHCPGFGIWQASIRSYDRLGNDPLVGHRLVWLLHQAGAAPIRNNWLFFGGCAGDKVFEILVANLIGILEGARDTIVGFDLLDRESYRHALIQLSYWSDRPDAAMWFSLSFAAGRREALEDEAFVVKDVELTKAEQLLLMAAAVCGLGPRTDLSIARAGKVVYQAMDWAGLLDRNQTVWIPSTEHPGLTIYQTLMRMTNWEGGPRAERPGEVLFEAAASAEPQMFPASIRSSLRVVDGRGETSSKIVVAPSRMQPNL